MCVCSKTLLILFTTPVVESILIIIKGCNYINNEDIVPFVLFLPVSGIYHIKHRVANVINCEVILLNNSRNNDKMNKYNQSTFIYYKTREGVQRN